MTWYKAKRSPTILFGEFKDAFSPSIPTQLLAFTGHRFYAMNEFHSPTDIIGELIIDGPNPYKYLQAKGHLIYKDGFDILIDIPLELEHFIKTHQWLLYT